MPFWSGEKLVQRGHALIDEFDAGFLDCNAYLLRMGGEYFGTAHRPSNIFRPTKTVQLAKRSVFTIPPGQFAYLLSKEIVTIPPDAMAFISMRTEMKFSGLINVSGFHVNPGYRGKLIYAVYNAGPQWIQIRENDRIFKIWFCDLSQMSLLPYIEKPESGINSIGNEVTKGMNSQVISLQSLAQDLSKIRSQMRIQAGVFAAGTAIALILFAVIFGGLWDERKPQSTASPIVVQTNR